MRCSSSRWFILMKSQLFGLFMLRFLMSNVIFDIWFVIDFVFEHVSYKTMLALDLPELLQSGVWGFDHITYLCIQERDFWEAKAPWTRWWDSWNSLIYLLDIHSYSYLEIYIFSSWLQMTILTVCFAHVSALGQWFKSHSALTSISLFSCIGRCGICSLLIVL